MRLAQEELRLAEESGDAARITKAKQDLARELEEAESAQAVAERERMEAEQAEAEAAKVSARLLLAPGLHSSKECQQ